MPGPPRRRSSEGSSRYRLLVGVSQSEVRLHAEEARAAPGGAGNRPRNGREALVRAVAPEETIRHNRHGVALALVLAHEHRAGLEAPGALGSALVAMSEAVQELHGAWIKPAKSLLLEVPADEPGDEVLGEGARRRRPKRPPPERAKLVEAERPHAVDLGLDCLAIQG